MEKFFAEYTKWKTMDLPEDLRAELDEIEGKPDEIWDRFCKDIEFGTSGLRGKMGAGTNRINSVVLRKASLGVAKYLTERYERPGLAISFDTRINSREYAAIVSEVFAENGVDAFIFAAPTPVPVLSFAVRFLRLNGGIMITASHNTKEYNGYKVYDHFGNQIDNSKARILETYIKKEDPFAESSRVGEKGRVTVLKENVKEAYLEAIKRNTLFWDKPERCREALGKLSVCYTPLNGAGLEYVTEALDTLGTGSVKIVESQKAPDGNFPTCASPNPENDGAFYEALKMCADNQCDVILATDPDSDRMGAAVLTEGGYCKLTGNQVGELMFDYILRCLSDGRGERKLREGMVAFKSFVSSPLVEKMGRAYGVQVRNVFTGFKNIVFEIEKLKEAGREDDFIFGFEESLGYLYGDDYTRDKDGVMACQMLCLMAAQQKSKGSNLLRRLEEIYEEFGYTESITTAIVYKKEKDRERMSAIMTSLFEGQLRKEPEWKPLIKKEFCFRQQNMYMADLQGGNRLIIRPSGTELKLKIYIFAGGSTRDEAIDTASELCGLARRTLEEKNE